LTPPTDADTAFRRLCADVAQCRRCPAMEGRCRVLSPANGPLAARVLFVAEAPGRLGAERSGVPLSGDASGRHFEALLAAVGWRRADVFVTNAALCNPRAPDGNRNRRPTETELAACAAHLRRQLDLVAAPVVAPLGAVALAALSRIAPHSLTLAASAGQAQPWAGRWLFPLYHPSPRALLHRTEAEQGADMHALRRFVDGLPLSAESGGRR